MAWKGWLAGAMAVMLVLGGCATDPTPEEKVAAPFPPHNGKRVPITVGPFTNRTEVGPGAASGAVDSLAVKARKLLLTQLLESQRFVVAERVSPAVPPPDARVSGREFRLRAAGYEITGDIVGVGRREAVTGLFGGGRAQLAFVGVTVYVVNDQASDAVYGARGYAEEETSPTGPDAAQVDRLLERAIREGVKDLIEAKDRYRWGQEL